MAHRCCTFNQDKQGYFMCVIIRGFKYCVLHIVNHGIGYSKSHIVGTRSGETMERATLTLFMLRHGASVQFSADSEFTKGPMKKFLFNHSIELNERPVRGHNKMGIIEKNITLSSLFSSFYSMTCPKQPTPCCLPGQNIYQI